MANDTIELRNILFDTLRDLRDKKDPMDIERARTISQVAQTAISLAKVEVDHMKVTGAPSSSGFLPAPATPTATGSSTQQVPALPKTPGVAEQIMAANVTRHECK
jgi:hypothetical protein